MAEKQGEPSDSQPLPWQQHNSPLMTWQPMGPQPSLWPITMATPQQTIIIQVAQERRGQKNRQNYKSRLSQVLGITQIVGAVLAIIFNSIGFWLHYSNSQADSEDNWPHSYGSYHWFPTAAYYKLSGIWGGVFLILSGAFAICAANKKSKCTIITQMVMAILAAFVMFLMGISSGVATGTDVFRLKEGFAYTRFSDWENPYIYITVPLEIPQAQMMALLALKSILIKPKEMQRTM